MPKLNRDEILNYIDRLKQIEINLSKGNVEDNSFLDDLNGLMSKLNKEFTEQSFNSTSDLIVHVKRIHPNAVIPSYAKYGDAGMDLTITEIKEDSDISISYGYGISIEIPFGYVGLIFPRSSVRKYDLVLSNCVGVIDSGYRGELMSTFKKIGKFSDEKYKIGEKGAQIVIIPIPKVKLVEVDNLSDSDRGDGGFGSSGN